MSRPARLLAPLVICAAATALAAPARAAYFPAETIDGPDPAIRTVGDVDVARDGTGAVAYVKRDGAVDHIFVSRLLGGAWQAPERVDVGLDGAGSQPVVAASDGGRVTVAYVSGGSVFSVLRTGGGPAFAAPQLLAAGASNPSVDMSINGAGYVSYTQNGDVHVAHMDRTQTLYTVLPDTLDADPARDAGSGTTTRSDVAVSADGTAVVTWGEAGHVFARRIFYDHVSVAPQDLNVANLDGHAGGAADSPTISIEDDSSYAWATMRQQFDDGKYHTVAQRLRGSLFEQATRVDALDFGSGDQTVSSFVAISGRGQGIATTSTAGHAAQAALLHDDTFFPAVTLANGSSVDPQTVGGIAENNDAFAFWLQGGILDATVHAVSYDIDPAKRTVPPPGPDQALSDAAQGAVDVQGGFDAGVNRAGDAVSAFIVDGTGGRRLQVAGFDRAPGAFRTYTTAKYRKYARPPLSWASSFELWGPITYDVQLDGQSVGTTTETKLTPLNPVADGIHTWRVVATDRRGQTASAPTRTLRVDATPPELTFKVTGSKKKGKPVTVTVSAADGSLASPTGSGIKYVRIDFGDRTRLLSRKAVHRYAKGGSYTVRVSAADKAGNTIALTRKIRIKKK